MKILFVHDSKYEVKDGLWAALNLLEKDGFEIERWNLQTQVLSKGLAYEQDFILGWGAFNSPVDRFLQSISSVNKPMGLCLGGYSAPIPGTTLPYDILFYETNWTLKWLGNGITKQLKKDCELVHAFGVNTDIYKPIIDAVPIWDWITVGAFSTWKRQEKLINKGGYKLAIGEIQKDNLPESMYIISNLLSQGIAVSDMVEPEYLAKIYNSAENVHIPASIMGGGERAVLEARACGRHVVVEQDNPKLQELLTSSIYNHYYYYEQLRKGILTTIR